MSQVEFRQVDVFTSVPFKGNPVAVVMDARELDSQQMQSIARWTNLSETTFVLPSTDPQADYQLRIFTPSGELPFAGHPTIGSAYALIEAGIVKPKNGTLIQQCKAGLVSLAVSEKEQGQISIAFELPEPNLTPLTVEQTKTLENILGCQLCREIQPYLVDVGARWIVAQADNAHQVLNTTPDYSALKQHDLSFNATGVCLYGYYPESELTHIEVRSFAPTCDVNEDPVCGSGNGAVAAFIRRHNLRLPMDGVIQSTQGQKLHRDGQLQLTITSDAIWVGGQAVTCISGRITY
uniref:Phenazine biosynthesis protein PhzF family n=1 Tax=Providencia alcalifaciens Ban1 TaxID=663916 RepID=C9E4G9_9GAMM|nr:phenazine biosynthesis protein PhzF family [Providencia alcalifaciens Ban1]